MDFEKEDLIIPTFILVALTFVWVTGSPSMETVKIEEVQQFRVDSEAEFGEVEVYSPQNIVCTSDVELWTEVIVGEDRNEVLPKLEDGASEPGQCAVVREVEKTKVELYGFEVVL